MSIAKRVLLSGTPLDSRSLPNAERTERLRCSGQWGQEDKIMTITRGIAAAVTFAGLALATASTAWADTTMSGHYTWTTTTSGGWSMSGDYYVTPCGDGCASIATTPGGPAIGQARVVDGQWTMDGSWPVRCADGSPGPREPYHDTWDPNTLEGTSTYIYNVPACGHPQGYSQTIHLQLRQVP